MATKSRRKSGKSARSASKRGAARKRGKRAGSRPVASKRGSGQARKQTPVARVKRVTREVVHQAAVAMTAGVETLKDLGENLVDRVRT